MLFHKGFIPGAQLFCHILREALTAVLLRQAEAVEVLPVLPDAADRDVQRFIEGHGVLDGILHQRVKQQEGNFAFSRRRVIFGSEADRPRKAGILHFQVIADMPHLRLHRDPGIGDIQHIADILCKHLDIGADLLRTAGIGHIADGRHSIQKRVGPYLRPEHGQAV